MLAAGVLGLTGTPAAHGDQGGDGYRIEDALAVNLAEATYVRVQASWPPTRGQPALTVTCTGFVVHTDGFVVTAGHCLDPGPAGTADAPARGRPAVTVVVAEGAPSHDPVAAEVLEARTGEGDDLALLRIPHTGLPTARLARRDPAQRVRVSVGGFPTGVTIVNGADATLTVSSFGGRPATGGAPVDEIGWLPRDGMAGGPLMEYGGTVVGVTSPVRGESGTTTRATPVSRVHALLARHRLRNELGPVGRPYDEGVRLVYGGEYAKAVAPLRRVVALNPYIPNAQGLLRLAQDPPERRYADEDGGGGGGRPLGLITGVAAALVVAGAAGGLWYYRRRRRGPMAPADAGPAPVAEEAGR